MDISSALSVEKVSKKFCRSLGRSLAYGVQDILADLFRLPTTAHLRPHEFWALTAIDFQLHRGETLGLVGANGAGKTTLLRIISGLIKPNAGQVRVRGRLAPLIALGAGFSPILTGRENIRVNMSILGLSSDMIESRFDEVVDFAEIGEAIDSPVQTYSSGMAARLGFSCAIHTSPDILLVDEVLAVGDFKFRNKCYRKLASLREQGTAIVLVSHNPQSILSNCDSAIYLRQGSMIASGPASEVMDRYERDMTEATATTSIATDSLERSARSPHESQGLDITAVFFRDAFLQPTQAPLCGQRAFLCIACTAHESIPDAVVTLLIRELAEKGDWMLRLSNHTDREAIDFNYGTSEIRIELPHFGLRPGHYVAKLSIARGQNFILDALEAFRFRIAESVNMSQCLFYQPRIWKVVRTDALSSEATPSTQHLAAQENKQDVRS